MTLLHIYFIIIRDID